MHQLRQHIEGITPVSDEEFEYIQTFFTTKRVKKHQYLIQEGDTVSTEYWIVSGTFRAFYLDEDGKEHIVQFAVPGWWLSDYSAFFSQAASRINVVCMEDAEVYCLTLLAKEKMASEMHKMEHFFRVKLSMGYAAQQRRIISLLSNNPRKRYEEFAAMYPGIVQSVPKKYIAEYLGVSRETLSRLYS